MRKSPGKWLKTLFGKKSSRSSSTKSKNSSEKALTQGYEAPLGDNSPIISEPVLVSTYSNTNLPIVEETHFSDMHGCETTLPVISQSKLDQTPIQIDESRGCNQLCKEKAATKAQAAIRGFLARRKFRALKGIVRLQALIRGHLVRRQAVATLYAMHAIVRLQAIVRGRIARHPDISLPMNYPKKQHDVLLSYTSGDAWKKNFHDNSLGHQLLSSRVVFKPLLVQFKKEDPNSVSSWLERWHLMHFWKPVVKANHTVHSKPQQRKSKKVSPNQPLKTNPKLTKHQPSNSEPEKRKANLHSQTSQVPKTEIEKPKRGLIKVSNSKSDVEIGKLSPGIKRSQNTAEREVSKNSETASETVDAKPSEARLSLSGDGESKKVIHKRSSLSTPEEVAEKELHVEVITSEGKSLSGNREAGSKSNSRRSSHSTTRLEIPEKELHSTVSSSAAKTLLDRNASEEKPFSSTRDSSNKLNNKRRSSLSDASKTMAEVKPSEEKPLSSSGNSGNKLNSRRSLSDASKTMRDGKPSEEKPLSSSGDSADNSGNKLNRKRRSSLSDASKTIPDGKPSEEKPLSSSGDSADKSNNRRRSSLSTTRLEISENELNVSVNKSASKIMIDVNSSEEKSLSSNGEPANRSNNRRRSSFSAGIEIPETELHSSTLKSVPSYMATTESAKARLRGQSSPRVVTTPDTADKNGPMRRHSLPSGSANGKLKSISPRTQKPVQSGGSKGLIKGERSLNLSRDGSEKSIHTEWRRS